MSDQTDNGQWLPGRERPAPIAILSPNPAVDMTYRFTRLIENQKVHADETRFDPGGNGVNVSRALWRLGVPGRNFCVVAGEIGRLFQRLADGQMGETDYLEVEGETRINGTFIGVDPPVQYEVSGIGPALPKGPFEALLERFTAHAGGGFGILTGALQQCLPDTFYGDLALRLRGAGARVVVDSRGEGLRRAIEAGPFLIKPNRFELEGIVGVALPDLRSVVAQARLLVEQGVEHVCVSLDREGAVLVGDGYALHGVMEKAVARNSSVGAGDSMVAALVAAFARGAGPEEALTLAIACSAATVEAPGTELFAPERARALLGQVRIERIGR